MYQMGFILFRLFAFLFFTIITSCHALAEEKLLVFAVGHDHDKMTTPNYPMYNAKWQFITQSLGMLGYKVEAKPLPWARAKHLTQTAKADGLFLAANLPGREKWANLSDKLGYGVFGSFYHIEQPQKRDVIASIRLGMHDRIYADLAPEDLLLVSTAHQGFGLLHKKKVDQFLMSESYGRYLLNTELAHFSEQIDFDSSQIEQRTTHIAFSKNHPRGQVALDIVNKAIALGIEKKLYQQAMEKNKVPKRMQLALD